LVSHGVVENSAREIGLIEHIGRRTGLVRVTPVHPVATDDGFRIIVPLGLQSRWAQNVLAAGRCRLQLGEVLFELDEPILVAPSMVDDLPRLSRAAMDWLGFRYLSLHRVAERPGRLATDAGRTDAVRHEQLVPA
jgi:deazaflavin-dependent oxidoreductase (nitroreductase family)